LPNIAEAVNLRDELEAHQPVARIPTNAGPENLIRS
jgi:hypothetical protein